MPNSWNYERVNENGYLQSYYGVGQAWTYKDKVDHEIKVAGFTANPNGVQYYWIAVDGKFQEKAISVARLHYLLHEKNAVEVAPGVPQSFPLLIKEVERYMATLSGEELWKCSECGGTGITDEEKVCYCVKHLYAAIKGYNADLRLKARGLPEHKIFY